MFSFLSKHFGTKNVAHSSPPSGVLIHGTLIPLLCVYGFLLPESLSYAGPHQHLVPLPFAQRWRVKGSLCP